MVAKRPRYVVEFRATDWKSVGIFSANTLLDMDLITAEEHGQIRTELDMEYGENVGPAAPPREQTKGG